jgi:hypothetical protein
VFKTIDLADLTKVKAQLDEFNWTFKHGDNIMYNFEVLSALYGGRKNLSKAEVFNKPITITIVSILEAMLIDFLDRLHIATNHLPKNLPPETVVKIKAEIEKAKRPTKTSDGRIYYRRKMYKLSEIVGILEKHELFGKKGSEIYRLLGFFGDMRNRVHIENYHGVLESDESLVFSSPRLASLEQVLELFWNKMVSDYKRPWNRARA